MVRDTRIKEYIFPATSVTNSGYVATGSRLSVYSEHSINGELLRVQYSANFTGSLILGESGLANGLSYGLNSFSNATTASGTGKQEMLSFTNTTGSFVTNGTLNLVISGVASGTGVTFGQVKVLYR